MCRAAMRWALQRNVQRRRVFLRQRLWENTRRFTKRSRPPRGTDAKGMFMGAFDDALLRLGITLPPAPKPVAAYVPFTRSREGTIFVSGQLPFKDGKLLCTGAVPSAVSVE